MYNNQGGSSFYQALVDKVSAICGPVENTEEELLIYPITNKNNYTEKDEINSMSFIVNTVSTTGTIICLTDSIITTKTPDSIIKRLLNKMCYNPDINCVISHSGIASFGATNFQKNVFDYFMSTKEKNIIKLANEIFSIIKVYTQPLSLPSEKYITFTISGYSESTPVCFTIDYSPEKFVMQRFTGNFFVTSGIESYKKVFMASKYSDNMNHERTYSNLVMLYRSIDEINVHFKNSDTVGGWLKAIEFDCYGKVLNAGSYQLSSSDLPDYYDYS